MHEIDINKEPYTTLVRLTRELRIICMENNLSPSLEINGVAWNAAYIKEAEYTRGRGDEIQRIANVLRIGTFGNT